MTKRRTRTITYRLVDESGCYVVARGPLWPWGDGPEEMGFSSLADARFARDQLGGPDEIEIIKETVEAVR